MVMKIVGMIWLCQARSKREDQKFEKFRLVNKTENSSVTGVLKNKPRAFPIRTSWRIECTRQKTVSPMSCTSYHNIPGKDEDAIMNI